MRSFNIIDFCWLLRDAVRYSTSIEDGDCKEIKTFRFINSPNAIELTTDGMGAFPCDRGRPFFYSKAWEGSGYKTNSIIGEFPALFLYQESASREKALERGKTRKLITIGVVDRLAEDSEKGRCSGCKGRLLPEIFQDTEEMLAVVLKYLAGAGYFVINTDTEGIFNRALVSEWLSTGQISVAEETFSISELIHSLNRSVNLGQTYFPSDRIYGTQVSLMVEFEDCQIPEYTYNTQRFAFDR